MVETLDGLFQRYGTALKLRSQRQEVLASNIANADTPQYKARDFDFAAELKAKLDSPSLATPTNPVPLQYRVPQQDSMDGNTVDLDFERAQFANNALHYEANLTVLTAHIKDLIAATTSSS